MKYLYFWQGPFSNWYRSNFELDGIRFNTNEQYMMYKKAMLFNDTVTANAVLKSNNPKECKALGRKVSGFDNVWWQDNCIEIVFRGAHAKFSQNRKLYNMLMNTGEATLVEASPFDKIWGIGLDEENAKKTNPDDWPGTNWLGIILTDLREHFLMEEELARKQNV
jgi:ribA/ribD-fused uncharacterized protein